MKRMLESLGYQQHPETGVWTALGYGGIAYSDGDEIEQRMAQVMLDAKDLSVLSDNLKEYITDWPSLYHLSSSRANLLRPFANRLTGAAVLEIGAGCGAITRYLGESGAHVLALEGSPRRAAIARARTRELPHIEVLAERFDQFTCEQKFDVITLIGVLEYANQFTPGENPALEMLRRARSLLQPGGLLIIAIENQLGLKYWAGAPEDHLGVPMYGIEGRYRCDEPQTYGRKVLAEMLSRAGFNRADFLSPLPDYKLPISILTPGGMASDDFDAAAIASQSVRLDPQLPKAPTFSPELAWPSVMLNQLGTDLANSFLIAAGDSGRPLVESGVLAYHYSTGRARGHCKQTIFRRSESGGIDVYCNLLEPVPTDVQPCLLSLQLPGQTSYVHGQLLSSELTQLVTREDWSIDAVGSFLKQYLSIVSEIAFADRRIHLVASVHSLLPGNCFDLVPQNIIRDTHGSYQAIDREWILEHEMPVGWLLFRTLLLLTQNVTQFGKPKIKFGNTRRDFFLAAFLSAGFEVDSATLESFAQLESSAQSEATGRTVASLANWWADSPLPIKGVAEPNPENDSSADALALKITCLEEEKGDLQFRLEGQAQSKLDLEWKIGQLNDQIARKNQDIADLQKSLQDIRASKIWRLTSPLRMMPTGIGGEVIEAKLLPDAIKIGGGLIPTLRTAIKVLRNEGMEGIRWRMSNVRQLQRGEEAIQSALIPETRLNDIPQIIPYYPDPRWDNEPRGQSEKSLHFALHCYLGEQVDALTVVRLLESIPFGFDLYVSVAGHQDANVLLRTLKESLSLAGVIRVVKLSASARPFASLINCFGRDLSNYPTFGHLSFVGGDNHAPQSLIGPQGCTGGRLSHLVALMTDEVSLILGERRLAQSEPKSVAKKDWVERLIKAGNINIVADCGSWHLHGNDAFLAKKAVLREMREAVQRLDPEGNNAGDSEQYLSDALDAVLPAFAHSPSGKILQIQSRESVADFPYYEPQVNYARSIVHKDVRVLSYYLPQFHPTPENDEWHGTGFTEWTKVRAANPLFKGHYQQHIPHSDIGYYLLDSPDVLRRQVSEMRRAGVHGQVFYHYWFSGRMILEKPAQMLLSHPDIAMPFCFCWANENWTRRWDGNEREILLGQTYSADDAKAFIRYLIPYFKDSRYIRVGTRPVLMVYRPSSIPNPSEYIGIWAEECASAGVDIPYVVAVLTRGATNPNDFQMDAGTERVLHDWTDGNVEDQRSSLQAYWPMTGGVLSYDDVRNFYTAQRDRKPFDYFRSTVPMWDNTARYGTGALLLHGSTPESFQRWMEEAIADAEANLPSDRRFVIVNAWNEWAEGTHLEPDARYGYSYLNSVGRALSGISFESQLNYDAELPKDLRVHIDLSPSVKGQIDTDRGVRRRLLYSLRKSTIFGKYRIGCDDSSLEYELPSAQVESRKEADVVITINIACIFSKQVLEKMISTAWGLKSTVVPNFYGDNSDLAAVAKNGAVANSVLLQAPIRVDLGKNFIARRNTAVRMRTDSWCFEIKPDTVQPDQLPMVTTIVRVHEDADLDELENALSCLNAMRNCAVLPLIATQNFNDLKAEKLTAILANFHWAEGVCPMIHRYETSNGIRDLRSVMLNESLKKVATQYCAFLDYDDLLFPSAYATLIDRIKASGKSVAFGRVFSTSRESVQKVLVKREKAFQYGYSYKDFVGCNHAPLHSFLFDISKMDLSGLKYFPDQKYMEDYLLTLQIFSERNADWDGLSMNIYIGDYIHSSDREHTLAISDPEFRQQLFSNAEYLRCEGRIKELRKKLTS
ncbi:glycoside hydrolase family 99-like domain-containing protein [Acidovorax sp. Leaf160]|uniref:glycoside hydrolase family 99-like domain-containing protein n=1 Tax=Acidovorax sp. Leaf160 TaxID=1736280 RepID=UPI0006F78D87|nr:glycoside hydrolase family 99-like domain-containing protein [Acidovorax sp. Leaf160]KQR63365.1 methyltransferase type 12 [Acidovorax sp. Leaf160]